MDKHGMFGEMLEQGQSAIKTAKKQMADTAKAAASQLGGNSQSSDQASQPGQVDQDQQVDNTQFVKDLYGIQGKKSSSAQTTQANQTNNQQLDSTKVSEDQDPKKIEEKQKLAKLRQELHQEVYYDPLVNPKKEKPEERPAEKLEKEKQIEQMELQKKEEKKPAPLAVKRAQTSAEANRGVSG
jgi:hypothetical protein